MKSLREETRTLCFPICNLTVKFMGNIRLDEVNADWKALMSSNVLAGYWDIIHLIFITIQVLVWQNMIKW